MAYWLMVTSEESFNATKAHNVLGFYGDSKGHALINKTDIGDVIIFYVTKKKVAHGAFRVTSRPFIDESPLYGDRRDEDWNQRITLEPIDTDAEVDFRRVVWDMSWYKNQYLSYSAYLVSTLLRLTEQDANIIFEELGIRDKVLPPSSPKV